MFYNDLKAIYKIKQAYEAKVQSYDYVTSVVEDIHIPEIEKVLLQNLITEDFDFQEIKSIFDSTFFLENMIICISGKELEFEANRSE